MGAHASISAKWRDADTMPHGVMVKIREESWKQSACPHSLEITTKDGTVSVLDLGLDAISEINRATGEWLDDQVGKRVEQLASDKAS